MREDNIAKKDEEKEAKRGKGNQERLGKGQRGERLEG